MAPEDLEQLMQEALREGNPAYGDWLDRPQDAAYNSEQSEILQGGVRQRILSAFQEIRRMANGPAEIYVISLTIFASFGLGGMIYAIIHKMANE